jgi:large subunit ribosomal protein L23
LRPYQILLRPLVTEKGTHLSEHRNTYCFQVHPAANKIQIKAAVEEMYQVRVIEVRTQNRKGKRRRYRQIVGQLPRWKKAIVQVHPEDKIEFY